MQGTAEGAPFDRATLDALLDLAVGRLRRADRDPEAPRSRRDRRLVLATRNAAQARRAAPDPRRGWLPVEVVGLGGRSRRTPMCAETGATFADNALLKARAVAAGDRAARGRRRLRPVRRRAERHARRALRALGRRATATTGPTSSFCSPRSRDVPDERRRRRVRLRRRARPAGRREHVVEGAAGRAIWPRAARHQRLRLRPDLRAGRRDPHHRRDDRRRRRTRSATAARRSAPSRRWWPTL